LAFKPMTQERFDEIKRGAAAIKAARKEAERKFDQACIEHAKEVLKDAKWSKPMSVDDFIKYIDGSSKTPTEKD
jgi:hypothetical protein